MCVGLRLLSTFFLFASGVLRALEVLQLNWLIGGDLWELMGLGLLVRLVAGTVGWSYKKTNILLFVL